MVAYPLTVKWSQRLENYCAQNRIHLGHPLRVAGLYTPDEAVRINGPVRVERYGTLVRHSFFSVGAFSYANNWLPWDTKIGRYCSIAPRVEVMTAQHPIERFTTSPITYLSRWPGYAQREFQTEWEIEPFQEMPPAPVIGNDVWIGQDVLIKGGITIGDGACIASRAVVSKDVPPYAIMGGVPARVIRYRFTEAQRERMLALKWWQYRFVDLPKTPKDDIDRFCDGLEELVAAGLRPWEPGFIDVGEEFARVAAAEG